LNKTDLSFIGFCNYLKQRYIFNGETKKYIKTGDSGIA
jgi:hypothetical protein